jgi:tRNA dimethylallyltransferase
VTPGVLILSGPTASGKTDLGIALARRFDAEIVGADSRQVYRGMPVGTAAPRAEQLAAVRHHLVGFLDPSERYSAARFVADALAAIEEIASRGKRAIVVGGTGFYIRALCGDVALAGERDEVVRARLAREALLHPPEVMHDWLAALDPSRARAIRPSDRYRVVRALELALVVRSQRGPMRSELRTLRSERIPFRKFYLDLPQAEIERRIAARVDRMLEGGLLTEAERLGGSAVAADAVGYPQALAYLRGFSTRAELRAHLIRATRRYAKRQATWFRTEPDLERVTSHDALSRIVASARTLAGWEAAGDFRLQA